MLTFQQIILTLQDYWDQQGCALLQPIDLEVGAGTSHTATFLRAIGPEPWKAAYVQPSRRPKDGRYGENPNRLQHYYQYQVVLKPAPENILELYLGSLAALGLDLKKNDVRFVEDDWENPTLGAWGLGWEVSGLALCNQLARAGIMKDVMCVVGVVEFTLAKHIIKESVSDAPASELALDEHVMQDLARAHKEPAQCIPIVRECSNHGPALEQALRIEVMEAKEGVPVDALGEL